MLLDVEFEKLTYWNFHSIGMLTSLGEFFWWGFYSLLQIYRVPDRFARKHGAVGCIFGLLIVPFYFLYAVVVLIDRVGVATANNLFGCQWLYFIDRSTVAKVYRDMSSLSSGQKVSDVYVEYIKEARQFAIEARDVFDSCNPSFPETHWHWKEVELNKLAEKVKENGKSQFSEEEFNTLLGRLEWSRTRMKRISYNRFCLFVGEALRGRFEQKHDNPNLCSITAAVDCYLK